jgi:hypothetical protein
MNLFSSAAGAWITGPHRRALALGGRKTAINLGGITASSSFLF